MASNKVLTQQQDDVIVLLLSGQSQKDAAEAVGVSPETVSRWMSGDALFVATLNARRQEVWDRNAAKLGDLASEAVDVIVSVMRDGDSPALRLRAALAVLHAQGLDSGGRPCGSTSAERIGGEWKARALMDGLASF